MYDVCVGLDVCDDYYMNSCVEFCVISCVEFCIDFCVDCCMDFVWISCGFFVSRAWIFAWISAWIFAWNFSQEESPLKKSMQKFTQSFGEVLGGVLGWVLGWGFWVGFLRGFLGGGVLDGVLAWVLGRGSRALPDPGSSMSRHSRQCQLADLIGYIRFGGIGLDGFGRSPISFSKFTFFWPEKFTPMVCQPMLVTHIVSCGLTVSHACKPGSQQVLSWFTGFTAGFTFGLSLACTHVPCDTDVHRCIFRAFALDLVLAVVVLVLAVTLVVGSSV